MHSWLHHTVHSAEKIVAVHLSVGSASAERVQQGKVRGATRRVLCTWWLLGLAVRLGLGGPILGFEKIRQYISLVLGGDIVTYSVHLPSNGVSGGPAMIPFSLVTSDWSMISTFIEHAWACMEERVNQNKMQQLMKEVAKLRVGSSYTLVPGSIP